MHLCLHRIDRSFHTLVAILGSIVALGIRRSVLDVGHGSILLLTARSGLILDNPLVAADGTDVGVSCGFPLLGDLVVAGNRFTNLGGAAMEQVPALLADRVKIGD